MNSLSGRRIIPACFVLSGMAGLIFETVWSRSFGLILGNSLHGISAVVAFYLGGLGVGAALAGRLRSKISNPFKAYAFIELAIALWGIMGAALLPALPGIISSTLPFSGPESWSLNFWLYLVTMLFLFPPTLLMGMTLPLLVEGLGRGGGFLPSLGLLYGLNTLGAFAGAFLGGFAALPLLGEMKTTFLAAALDIIVFTVAGLVLVPRLRTPASGMGKTETATVPARKPALEWSLGGLFLVTGALALVMEIGWTRALSLIINSSSYSFSLILSVILAGIGAGSLIWKRLPRTPSKPLRAYGGLWVLIGISGLLSILLLNRSGDLFLLLYHRTSSNGVFIFAGFALLAASVVLPTSVLLGLHFPLSGEALRSLGHPEGSATGRALLWNSAGALTGSLAAGFTLLPSLGTARTLGLASALSVLLGSALLASSAGTKARRAAVSACGVATCLLILFRGPGLDRLLADQGIFRSVTPRLAQSLSLSDFKKLVLKDVGSRRLFYMKEGARSTVAVWHTGVQLSLTVGGKPASSYGDAPIMFLQGLAPLAFKPDAKRVFVVGYGAGMTAAGVLSPATERLDIAEIEPAVMEGARYFSHITGDPATDERVKIHIEDGRRFLTYSRDRYDIIISQPSKPWISGVNSLFTAEYYRIVREKLNPGGVFCQWFQLYELSSDSVKIMLSTMRSVFPNYAIFRVKSDLICICSPSGGLKVDSKWLASLAGTEKGRQFSDFGITGPEDFFVRITNDSLQTPRTGIINTDDNGYLEFHAPWEIPAFMSSDRWADPELFTSADLLPVYERLGWKASSPGDFSRLVSAAFRAKLLSRAASLASSAEAAGVRLTPGLEERVNRTREDIGDAPEKERAKRSDELMLKADQAYKAGDTERCIALLTEAQSLYARNERVTWRLVSLKNQTGDLDGAIELLETELHRGAWGSRYDILENLGVLYSSRDPKEAEAFFRSAVDMGPYRKDAYLSLGEFLASRGRREEALSVVEKGLSYLPGEVTLKALREEILEGPSKE